MLLRQSHCPIGPLISSRPVPAQCMEQRIPKEAARIGIRMADSFNQTDEPLTGFLGLGRKAVHPLGQRTITISNSRNFHTKAQLDLDAAARLVAADRRFEIAARLRQISRRHVAESEGSV